MIVDKTTYLVNILTIVVPATITVIGFIVNYLITRQSIKDAINRKKTDIHLEELSKVPKEILDMINYITLNNKENVAKGSNKKTQEKELLNMFVDLTTKIFAYGTKDAITIASSMQQYNYLNNNNEGKSVNSSMIMAYYIILFCQVKYDLTGIEISPAYWYKLRLTDYTTKYNDINEANNIIVRELRLKDFLIIKNSYR